MILAYALMVVAVAITGILGLSNAIDAHHEDRWGWFLFHAVVLIVAILVTSALINAGLRLT